MTLRQQEELAALLGGQLADGTASGRFGHRAAFMPMRAQAFTVPDEPDDFDQVADRSTSDVNLAELLDLDAMFTVGLRVPLVRPSFEHDDDGWLERLWLLSAGSWASVAADGAVRQVGRRRLWDEVEAAFRWWQTAGEPDLTRYGATISEAGQSVWLDNPHVHQSHS